MALTGKHTYVGYGFGAIQAGLFLYEAERSGNFGRLVVVDVVPEIVAGIRKAGGFYSLNIAHSDRIETVRVGPVEIYDPSSTADRERIVAALDEAHEIGTAIPSVEFYMAGGAGSLHRTLADGLMRKAERRGARAVVYTAENHNTAAEILEGLVLGEVPPDRRHGVCANVRFLNTVIGKMSGFVANMARNKLAPVTPRGKRAFLVEAFNRILVSNVRFDEPFVRGIEVFEEKDDLLPFEEAKLWGHNATHALAAYLGSVMGAAKIAELRSAPGLLPFLRDAFLIESGGALIRKHGGVDRLFSPDGYREYADDLLLRMTNPFLMDTVERVGRDPQRKLGWDDRLIGTMRLALSHGITPRRYAIGAAAAFCALDGRFLEGDVTAEELAADLWTAAKPEQAERGSTSRGGPMWPPSRWQAHGPAPTYRGEPVEGRKAVLALVEQGRRFLLRWRDSGFADLQTLFAAWQ